MRCSCKFPVLLVCLALVIGASAAKKDDQTKDGDAKDDAKKEPAKKKDKKTAATPAPATPDPSAPPAPAGASTAAADAKPKPKLSLPLPKGHSSIGVKFPYNDGTGKKTMSFDIGVATRLDDDHVTMKDLVIETYNDDTNEKEMSIAMPVSALNLDTRIISTHDGVTIKRSDFQVTGKNMEFNTETKEGQIEGDVKMIIYDMSGSLGGGSKPEEKP
jgi:type IV secretory pathway VirB10-like protein